MKFEANAFDSPLVSRMLPTLRNMEYAVTLMPENAESNGDGCRNDIYIYDFIF